MTTLSVDHALKLIIVMEQLLKICETMLDQVNSSQADYLKTTVRWHQYNCKEKPMTAYNNIDNLSKTCQELLSFYNLVMKPMCVSNVTCNCKEKHPPGLPRYPVLTEREKLYLGPLYHPVHGFQV